MGQARRDRKQQTDQVDTLGDLRREKRRLVVHTLSRGEVHGSSQREPTRTHSEKLRQELTELIAEQRIVEKALVALKRLRDECPTCGQSISSDAKASEAEKHGGRLAELEGLIQRMRERISEYADLDVAKSRLENQR